MTLEERVARAIRESHANGAHTSYLDDARAAIAIVVEEAAKIAEDVSAWKHLDGDFEANQVAAAIRSLKGGA